MSDKIFDPNELDLDFDSDLAKTTKTTSNKSSQTKKDDNVSVSKEKNPSSQPSPLQEKEVSTENKEEVNTENKEKNTKKEEKIEKKVVKKIVSADVLKTTLTDKSLLPEEMKKKIEKEEEAKKIIEKEKEMRHEEKNKIIFDINIEKITDLTKILTEKKYDFFTLEPTDTYSKITFFKNNINKETKYIKLPEYFSITTEAKAIAKLKTSTTHLEQK